MENGYVLFVVAKKDYKPYYLQFGERFSQIERRLVDEVGQATTYPIYEAAEAVFNVIKDDENYLYVRIFNADGTPCDEQGGSNNRYLRRTDSNGEPF